MDGSSQMIISMIVGIVLLIFLILRTRIHAFPAMIIVAALIGTMGGMGLTATMASLTKGFGGTLGSIGIIIGLGIMMGSVFEASGAAKRMAQTFIRLLGKGREEVALGITGFVVSIPIFCDSGFVILSPLARALARSTGKSLVTLGVSLAAGLVITHHLVPPTPGPLATAEYFGVPLGSMIGWSLLLAIPVAVAALAYAKYIGGKVYRMPTEDGSNFYTNPADVKLGAGGEWLAPEEADEKLPCTFMAFLPILLPVLLIVLGTVVKAMKLTGGVAELFISLGHPVVAVGIGMLATLYGLSMRFSREEVIQLTDKSVSQAGIILLVTGAGGALGGVLRDSGAAQIVAEGIVSLGMPAILLPMSIATIVRLMQGSGTVAMLTAASICAPMAATMGLNPVLGALACCSGSFIFGYFNDSYFWVVNRLLGVSAVQEQLRVWSVTTTICWAVSCSILLIANIFV